MPENWTHPLEERVRKVVLRHLPNSSHPYDGESSPTFAHLHALWICAWHDRGSEAFRRSRDATLAGEIIQRAEGLRNSILRLRGLDSDGLRYVFRKDGLTKHEKVDVVEILDLLIASGCSAASGIPHYTQADKKRNWSAMAVTEAARRAWGTEEWRQQNGAFDEWDIDVMNEACDMAPTSQHHDRPGPFGRFVNELMETFEILDRTGAPVSAATALNALRSIRRP